MIFLILVTSQSLFNGSFATVPLVYLVIVIEMRAENFIKWGLECEKYEREGLKLSGLAMLVLHFSIKEVRL
jgi:hypothetical protein